MRKLLIPFYLGTGGLGAFACIGTGPVSSAKMLSTSAQAVVPPVVFVKHALDGSTFKALQEADRLAHPEQAYAAEFMIPGEMKTRADVDRVFEKILEKLVFDFRQGRMPGGILSRNVHTIYLRAVGHDDERMVSFHDLYINGYPLSEMIANSVQAIWTRFSSALEDVAEGRVWISIRTEGERLEVDVTDNGSGISVDRLRRFFHEKRTISSKSPNAFLHAGSGEGIFDLASRIVEGFSGSLEIVTWDGADPSGARLRLTPADYKPAGPRLIPHPSIEVGGPAVRGTSVRLSIPVPDAHAIPALNETPLAVQQLFRRGAWHPLQELARNPNEPLRWAALSALLSKIQSLSSLPVSALRESYGIFSTVLDVVKTHEGLPASWRPLFEPFLNREPDVRSSATLELIREIVSSPPCEHPVLRTSA